MPTELALKIILPELCKPDIPSVVLQRPADEIAVKTCKEKNNKSCLLFPFVESLLNLGNMSYMFQEFNNNFNCVWIQIRSLFIFIIGNKLGSLLFSFLFPGPPVTYLLVKHALIELLN